VIQGARTESVPLGELKKISEERELLFDQELFRFTMGNCVTVEDTNGNRKLLKKHREEKIDSISALLDASWCKTSWQDLDYATFWRTRV
jgi:phage terminase large subunit-like protein